MSVSGAFWFDLRKKEAYNYLLENDFSSEVNVMESGHSTSGTPEGQSAQIRRPATVTAGR